MNGMCQCGMTLDSASVQGQCPDCGTAICRSCGIELEAQTYCRWCATSLAARAA
jgi:predicted RNA-binding Zn-ribbon protein involved in translation (DUF1610 family)